MEKIISKVQKQHKSAFLGSVIIGLLSYLYTITHHFLTYDSMWNLVSDQNMIESGRPFLTVVCKITSDYDLPALNGILAILYLALTAVILVDIFEIEKGGTAFLLGGLVVSFPSVASTFCYTYTIDGYMLAILIITVAFWLTNKYKYGFVAGIILTAFSLGIYQAYYAYLIALCIFYLLVEIIRTDKIKELVPKAIRYVVVGVGGYVLYVISLKILLLVENKTPNGYQGTDKVLSFDSGSLLGGIIFALSDALNFARWGHVFTITTPMKIAYALLLLSGIALFIIGFIKNKRYKSVSHIVCTVLLIMILPLGINFIAIMATEAYIHLLIRFSWVMIFVFVLVLSEKVEMKGYRFLPKSSAGWIVGVLSLVLIFEFAKTANIVAFNMEERYMKTYGLCLRIVDRLESEPDYMTGMEVAIAGGFPDADYYPSTSMTEEVLNGFFGVSGDYCVNSTDKVLEFCKHYLNFTFTAASYEKTLELMETSEFYEMTKFPYDGCVRKIDGVWVVKING